MTCQFHTGNPFHGFVKVMQKMMLDKSPPVWPTASVKLLSYRKFGIDGMNDLDYTHCTHV